MHEEDKDCKKETEGTGQGNKTAFESTAETGENEVISNFGMQDQSMALHWIARNIENFGGDPYKIVICGQSAGAGSVQTQLCSPMNRGIIAGAICQSAVSFCFGDEGVPV